MIPQRYNDGRVTHGEIVEMMILNRLHSPTPLYEVEHWCEITGVSDLYGRPSSDFNDDRIRSTLDVLHEYGSDIQDQLALVEIRDFGVPCDRVLCDTNLGLNVSAEGSIPLSSQVLPGNKADVTTVIDNCNNLRRVLGQKDFLMIVDGGMVSPQIVHELDSNEDGIKFIALWRGDKPLLRDMDPATWCWEEIPYKGGPKKDETYWAAEWGLAIEYEEKDKESGQKIKHVHWVRAIAVKSTGKITRDEKTRAKQQTKIEQELDKVASGLNKRRLKKREQVISKLDRLFSGSLQQYHSCIEYTLEGEDEQMSFEWRWNDSKVKHLKALDGVYVIITNEKDPVEFPPARVVQEYKTRNGIEPRMRNVKSNLKIRPLFVHTDERVASLVLITVLALIVYSLIEWQAHKAGKSWTTAFISKRFRGIGFYQECLPNGEIQVGWTNLSERHCNILKLLDIPLISLPDTVRPFAFT